jgi:hypothetical protein
MYPIPSTDSFIRSCDNTVICSVYWGTCPTPTPTPEPTPIPGGCNGRPDFELYPSTGCASGFVNNGGTCTRSNEFINRCETRFGGYDDGGCGCLGSCDGGSCSPVVVDVLGDGFALTDAAGGVDFDLDGDGGTERHSWSSLGSDEAWPALDRNGNGWIDSGRELFGNVTSQEPPADGEEMNGFNALALYDGPGYGGNLDDAIDRDDAVFTRLRLWQDRNHDGVSESCELFTLTDLGLDRIDLKYRLSRQTDQFRNQFRYRSRVRSANPSDISKWAWDVFLVIQ